MKKTLLLFLSCCFIVAFSANGQGTETFDNFNETGSSYNTGTFTGQDGSTWSYNSSRGDTELNGTSLMLGKGKTPAGSVESGTISGGCGELTLKYKQAYGTNANFEVYVNGTLVETITTSGESGVIKTSNAITVNEGGDIVIKISQTNSSSGQVCIDDITWTGYTSSTPKVSTPQFSIAGDLYTTTQNIEITTETDGATIYYTLDANEPTDASILYTAPIEVSATTTIKAIGYKAAHDPSNIASATYTFPEEVANIAALRAKVGEGGTYLLTSEAIITFMQSSRNQKVIQDATGGILIDDNGDIITSTYSQYDGITGLIGTLSVYNDLLQFIPVADPGAASSTANSVTPTEVTIPTLKANWEQYESTLIKITNLTFEDADMSSTFANSTSYNVTDGNSNTFVIRTGFRGIDLIGEVIPTTASITGVAQRYGSTYQMYPRSLTDVATVPTSIDNAQMGELKVGPNPFNNELRIESASDIKTVRLFNTAGQVIKNVTGFTRTIETADVPVGLYILQIEFTDGSSVTQKVIKK